MKNCDNCKYYSIDEEEWPCKYCEGFDRWQIAPDLAE